MQKDSLEYKEQKKSKYRNFQSNNCRNLSEIYNKMLNRELT